MSDPKSQTRRKVRREMAAAPRIPLFLAMFTAVFSMLPACSVDAHDKDKHVDSDIDIKSPIGDLHVSEDVDTADAGLSIYPGSKPAPKENKDDEKRANVNLALPGFSLKVAAAEFVSNDAPEKLIAFYYKELQRYGKPIQCHGEWDHVESSHGKDEISKPVSCKGNGRGNSIELKVGTEANQHIVSVKPGASGTRFAIAYVRMHTESGNNI